MRSRVKPAVPSRHSRLRLRDASAALLLCAALSVPGFGQTVRAYVDADSVTVGQRFLLVLVAEHEGTLAPVFPDSVAFGKMAFGDLDLLSLESRGWRMKDVSVSDLRIDSVAIEVATFALDTALVPAIPIPLVRGADTLVAATRPFFVPVRSLVGQDATDIQDLAPLVDFPRSWWPWILAAFVAAAVAYLVVYVFRKRKPATAPVPIREVLRTPYDEALERLRLAARLRPEDPEMVKPYFDELSGALRHYIGRALQVHAEEETTREIVRDLRAKADARVREVTPDVPERTQEILELSDLVKFADYLPSADRSRRTLDATRDTIDTIERGVRARLADEAASPAMDAPEGRQQ